MHQDKDSITLTTFEREQKQKLHELCDFIEEQINFPSTMPRCFLDIVQMCNLVDSKLFALAYERIGFRSDQIYEWLEGRIRLAPSNESATLIAQAMLNELRREIGTRPTPRVTVKESKKVEQNESALAGEEIPDGVVLSEKFPAEAALEDIPEWISELSTRVGNCLKNDNRVRLIDVLTMTAKEFLDIGNVSTKSLEELTAWCYKHGLRGVFFDHPKAAAVVKRLEENEENFKLSGGMA